MKSPTLGKILEGTVIALLALHTIAEAETIADARGLMGQFRQMASDLQAAQSAGDTEEMGRLAQTAQETLSQARRIFDANQASQSRDPDVLMDYADCLRLMGDADLAAEVYRRIVEREPQNAMAWLRLGENLAMMGGPWMTESHAALRQAITTASDPSHRVEAHLTMAAQMVEQGFHELAREHFEVTLDLEPEHPFARSAHAILGIRNGDVLNASETLDAVRALPPRPAAIVGRMLIDALDAFEQARMAIPDDAAHHAAYAKVLLRAGRVPESVMPLTRSLKLDPNVYVHWNLMASAQLFLGDMDEARRAYEQSIELHPDQPRVIEALEAIEDGEEPGLEIAPDVPPALSPEL